MSFYPGDDARDFPDSLGTPEIADRQMQIQSARALFYVRKTLENNWSRDMLHAESLQF